jgi:TRAP-type C4-dicarboxylate transport system substrate-binding protein
MTPGSLGYRVWISCIRVLRTSAVALAATVAVGAQGAEPIELWLSVETPPPHARNVAAARWAAAIERRSNGGLKVRIFPSAQLYDSGGAIRALASGALDLSVQASPTLSLIEPNLAVVALPMFFGATREEVRAVLDGPLGRELYARLEPKGILVAGGQFEYAPNNTAYTRDKPIRSYSDLRGVKLATPPSPIVVVMLRAMGAFPVPAPRSEVVMQLSQGQIDGIGSMTDLTISGGKLWDAGVRYGFRDDAGWGVYVPLVSAATASRLSPEQRRAIFDGWSDTRDWARAFTEKELVTGIETNAAHGVTVYAPTETDRDTMRAKLVAEQDALVRAGRMDPNFVARVGAYLNELRGGVLQ